MRSFAIVCTIATVGVFSWLATIYQLSTAGFHAFFFGLLACQAWRMALSKRQPTLRDYFFLAAAGILPSTLSVLFVMASGSRGHVLEREYISFARHIARMPEYKRVEATYTQRKGGRVYLKGHVPSKESHDRLIQIAEQMIQKNESGFYDGVEFPGKPRAK